MGLTETRIKGAVLVVKTETLEMVVNTESELELEKVDTALDVDVRTPSVLADEVNSESVKEMLGNEAENVGALETLSALETVDEAVTEVGT